MLCTVIEISCHVRELFVIKRLLIITRGFIMNELISQLTSKIGISEEQAQGGLGGLLSLAKGQLDSDTFSKVEGAIPGAGDLISKFGNLGGGEKAGGLGGMLSSATSALGMTSNLGGIAGMIGSLSSLGIDLDMMKKFAPIVTGFLNEKGLGDIASKFDGLGL